MSYLEELKQIYYRQIASIENDFKQQFQKVVDEKVKELIPKIKQNLEDNIVEYIVEYNRKGIPIIDVDGIDLTEAYKSEFYPIFDKLLKGQDKIEVKKTVEDFLEEQEAFKLIKKYLDTRFDGLVFYIGLFVELEQDYFRFWFIKKIHGNISIHISYW